ncbi:MAG TPA: site-2 protease family protein, partial [Candidatus Bathyarchaeia archaeon]
MSGTPNDQPAESLPQQLDFAGISSLVSAEFQVEEALLENDIPTYYLKQPQETKNAFLRLFKNLKSTNLMPVLRRADRRIVLRIVSKPPVKPSNILVNWILFFATLGTTFLTGYMLSIDGVVNPWIGGITFMVAIMAVLGVHEMGHKLTANKKQIEATPPYFIPGPPPLFGGFFGTFGAVIMQKSLPPNRDSLFDVGSSGPLVGFIVSVVAVFFGLVLSPSTYALPVGPFLPVPLFFQLAAISLSYLGIAPVGNIILLHPVAFAGMIGLIVTM